jgi:abhydrolase domain-containing protein 6
VIVNQAGQTMKNLILRLAIFILVLTGIVGYSFASEVTPPSSCTIATHSVTVGNGTLLYNQIGTGRPILLLHGLFASKEQWEGMMCQLSEAGYQAIAPDLPGYGSSTGFAINDYTLENQVALLHQWMAQLNIQSFDIAGSSMGGAIANLYSQNYPEQVRSLAFIGAPLGVIGWADSVREPIFEGINPFIPITEEQFDLEISLLFVTPPDIPDSDKAEIVNDYVTRNQHYQQVWNIVNLYQNVLCQKPFIHPPTLVIWGQEDKIYDIQGVNRLQRCIPRSQIIQLPAAGHLLLIENVAEATSNYIHFLQTARGEYTSKLSMERR